MKKLISAVAMGAAVAVTGVLAAGPAAAQVKPIAVFKVPVQAVNLHPGVTGVYVLCRLLNASNKTQFQGAKRVPKSASGAVNATVEVPVMPNKTGKLNTVKSYACLLGVYDSSNKPVVPGGKGVPAWAGVKPGAKRVTTVTGPFTP